MTGESGVCLRGEIVCHGAQESGWFSGSTDFAVELCFGGEDRHLEERGKCDWVQSDEASNAEKKLELRHRVFRCKNRGYEADRDVNAVHHSPCRFARHAGLEAQCTGRGREYRFGRWLDCAE